MSNSVPMIVIGCDHQRASSRWRSAVALNEQEQIEMSNAMSSHGMAGMIQIATCNRTEWITLSERPQWAAQILEAQFQRRWALAAQKESPPVTKPYVYIGDAALRHLMSVAAGLKSFAQGERQISGQVHRAFTQARTLGCSNAYLNMLETIMGKMTRQLSVISGIDGDAVGIHTVVMQRLKMEIGESKNKRVVVIGMGEIGQAIVKSLRHDGWDVVPYNRTPNADENWLPLADLRSNRLNAAAIIVSTGSQTPTWGVQDIHSEDCPLVIDVGSPAQVDPNVRGTYGLIDLDDLMSHGRPLLSDDIKAQIEHEIEVAIDIFERKLLRHSWSEAWRVHNDAYKKMSRETLPNCLSSYGLSPDVQSDLEEDLKRLIHDYGHRLLDGFSMALPGDDS